MFAALLSTKRGAGDDCAACMALSSLLPGHRAISLGRGCLTVEFLFALFREGEDFQVEPICDGRMKTGIEPDMTEESQLLALEVPNFVNIGFMTGRQALITPRRASRQVKSATRL